MKARVIATGEIVDVTHSHNITSGGFAMKKIYKDQLGSEYFDSELEFLQEEEEYIPDYWTRLEHQAAIAAMQGLCANAKFMQDHEGDFQCHEEMIAEYAKDIAHALVEKMKEERK